MPSKAGRSRKDHCQVVTLRSGRNLTIHEPNSKRRNSTSTSNVNNDTPRSGEYHARQRTLDGIESKHHLRILHYLFLHFPGRLKKKGDKQQFKKFLDVLNQLQINILFVNALEQMPWVSEKIKDPESFMIPFSIGAMDLGLALYDLGVSINLMPLSIFKKLGIREAQPMKMALLLVDNPLCILKEKLKMSW
ncbi:uncharacterized protein E5676_scaffold22G00130 [Cucumis melo var. makuwa]|uniref:Uncharacterized protein n=1 Tax=Cucumis melo var. makuwa TaxID=1194695 RepID=A0A5A7UFN5_CUCMM|nr:uncharacterized protein E6C27_scaffold24G003770 [Cucumis melo var. makuwa]TYK27546.1 uncharacterized protein E5676_scaffold22G00130 [Cucumis melo var. makuwa]